MSGGYRRPVWTRTSVCRGSRRNGDSVRFRVLDGKAHRDVVAQAPVARARRQRIARDAALKDGVAWARSGG